MDQWGQRELRTSKLVRLCAGYLLCRKLSAENIYGLCRLTWITSSDPKNRSYLRSTKLPAFSNIFKIDFLKLSDKNVVKKVSKLTGTEASDIKSFVDGETGYTNFYKAYRNSSKKWILQNLNKIAPLIRKGYSLKNDDEAEEIISVISKLPKIPKGNNSLGQMLPQNLLTPLFFSLDKRLRFPLINGNRGIIKLLKQLKVHDHSLIMQYRKIVSLIGKEDIKTSIDIDRLGGDLPDFVSIDGKAPRRKRLKEKGEKELNLQDEQDVLLIKKARKAKLKRRHNKMTNLLKKELPGYELHQGNSGENRFDVLIKNVNAKSRDLLIEVKSASTVSDVRMAVGQLMDYSRQLDNYKSTYRAVFIPKKPQSHVVDFLSFYKFYVMWIENTGESEQICSNNKNFPFVYKKL